jgi:hypothetical protein
MSSYACHKKRTCEGVEEEEEEEKEELLNSLHTHSTVDTRHDVKSVWLPQRDSTHPVLLEASRPSFPLLSVLPPVRTLCTSSPLDRYALIDRS